MTTIQNLMDSIEVHIRDFTNVEMTEVQLLVLINDASEEAGGSGWVRPFESANISAPVDGKSAAPATIAWIKDLRGEGSAHRAIIVERHYWRLGMEGSTPNIYFEESLGPPVSGYTTKYPTLTTLVAEGWARPSAYTLVSDTVDAGMESFLLDRASAHALRAMVAGTSELDRIRAQQSEIKMRDSQVFLDNIPEEFKVLPRARHVPGR